MNDEVHTILKQFPGPVLLWSSRTKWLAMFVGSSALVAGLYWLVATDRTGNEYNLTVAGIVVFGICALVSGLALLPGSGGMKLDGDGFTIWSLFRSYRFSWNQVSVFKVVDIAAIAASHDAISNPGGAPFHMVVFDDANATGRLAELGRSKMGHSGGLPASYGFDCEALASLLNGWRERALGNRVDGINRAFRGPWS